MTEPSDNIVLEHLRRIRASQERMEADIGDIKMRLAALEEVAGQLLVLLGAINKRQDRFEERLARVERRLELSP